MEKILFIILTFTTLSLKAQTSVYKPFPESNAIWNFQSYISCPSIVSFTENYSITITEDTVINSQIYHKLSVPAVIKSYDTTICNHVSLGYKGAFRQDVLNKKVFFMSPSSNTESLLYDFNIEVGDTIKGLTASYTDTVFSIDSVLVGSSYHKRWNFNQEFNISLIEGVGLTYGLIELSPGNAIGNFPYFNITCFSNNNISLYPNSSINCELITSLNKTDNHFNQIKIFPNPSTGALKVCFDKINITEIRITDIFGNMVFREVQLTGTDFEIKELNSGTYTLTLIDSNNKRINYKIIIIS